jgi:hypothetical protein
MLNVVMMSVMMPYLCSNPTLSKNFINNPTLNRHLALWWLSLILNVTNNPFLLSVVMLNVVMMSVVMPYRCSNPTLSINLINNLTLTNYHSIFYSYLDLLPFPNSIHAEKLKWPVGKNAFGEVVIGENNPEPHFYLPPLVFQS